MPFEDDFDVAEADGLVRLDDLTGAEECLTRVIETAARRRTRRLLWRCFGVLASVREKQGRTEEARLAREKAATVVDQIAASLVPRSLDTVFRKQPAVTEALGRVPTP